MMGFSSFADRERTSSARVLYCSARCSAELCLRMSTELHVMATLWLSLRLADMGEIPGVVEKSVAGLMPIRAATERREPDDRSNQQENHEQLGIFDDDRGHGKLSVASFRHRQNNSTPAS